MKLTNEEIKNYEDQMRKILDERKYGFEDNVHKIANETALIKNAINIFMEKGHYGGAVWFARISKLEKPYVESVAREAISKLEKYVDENESLHCLGVADIAEGVGFVEETIRLYDKSIQLSKEHHKYSAYDHSIEDVINKVTKYAIKHGFTNKAIEILEKNGYYEKALELSEKYVKE